MSEANALVATVRRRALVTHRIDPDGAAALLPAGIVPVTIGGHALVSLCYSDIRDLRPAGFPAAFGISFQYLVTRLLVRISTREGESFVSAHVLEALADSMLIRAGTRLTYRLAMQPATIELQDDDGTWRLSASAKGRLVTECTLRADSDHAALRGSVFDDFRHAFDTMLSMAHGTHLAQRPDRPRVLTQTFEPDNIRAGRAWGRSLPGAPELGLGTASVDHVLMGYDVPYRYSFRSRTVRLPAAREEHAPDSA